MVLNPVKGLAEAAAGGVPGATMMTEASEKEAQAVAAAIGLPRSLSKVPGLRRPTPAPDDEGAPLSKARGGSGTRTESIGADSPSPTGAFVISEPDSPDYELLDSPEMSDDEEGLEADEKRDERQEEEKRGRARSQDSVGRKRTGAKTFVFPKERRKSDNS